MRKFVMLFFTLLVFLFPVNAFCQSLDITTASDDDLKAAVSSITDQLKARGYDVEVNITKKKPSTISPVNRPIAIHHQEITSIDSAGGVYIKIFWQSNSKEMIKYVTFTATPYNKVEDVVYSDVGKESTITLTVTGPINKGEPWCKSDADLRNWQGGTEWEHVWYNATIDSFIISEVTITYEDDSIQVLDGENVKVLYTDIFAYKMHD